MVPRRELELAQSEVHALEAEARNLKAKLNESVPKEDYAALRGVHMETAERWLRPNLD